MDSLILRRVPIQDVVFGEKTQIVGVNLIPFVVAAKPGLISVKDLPPAPVIL